MSAERGCKHIGLNGARERVRQYQIDGGVLPKGQQLERCDYLLINDDRRSAYFIELKGSDLKKAIAQIETSVQMIAASLPGHTFYKRIIYHTGTKAMQNSDVLKWKKRNAGRALIKLKEWTESIN